MPLFRRKVRKFSSPESFRIFMEGLRSLQLYDEEASKEEPDRATLAKMLQDSRQQFQDCVSLFPRDLLPRYYLGIVLGVEAQAEHARYFEGLVFSKEFTKLQEVPLLTAKVTELLQRSAEEFRETAWRAGGGDLRSFALYNEAQALARMDRQLPDGKKEDKETTWEKAEEILLGISPDPLDKLPLSKWVLVRLPRFFSRLSDWLAELVGEVGDRVEGAPGIAASLASAVVESEAMKLQIELSYLFIKLRTEVYDQAPRPAGPGGKTSPAPPSPSLLTNVVDSVSRPFRALASWSVGGKDDGPPLKNQFEKIKKDLRDLMVTIDKSKIPSKLKQPMVADYWNKSAFVTWERALLSHQPDYLDQAEKYLEHITDKMWTPRQMNEIRLAMARGDKERATKVLQQVLGVLVPAPAPAQ